MNESLIPQVSVASMLDLEQKVRRLDERIGRVENYLEVDFSAPVTSPMPEVPLTAPELTAPETPEVSFPFVPVTADALPKIVPNSADSKAEPWPAQTCEPGADSTPDQTAPPRPAFSLGEWENLIGGKWALWIGSLCLFLAMASFLAYTWRSLPPAPPWAKVLMGFGSGLVLLSAGHSLRTQTQRYFSEGLSGAGLAICYLSLWAGGQYFSVLSHSQSFLGMALLTLGGVALAVRYDALSLSVLSALGGFLTPILLQSPGSSSPSQAVPFLAYVALLNAGILAVSLRKSWSGLVWLSFACTVVLIGGWSLGMDFGAMRTTTFLFFSLYFLLFLGASCFGSLLRGEATAPGDLLLLFAATSLYALTGYFLLLPLCGAFPGAFLLALSAFFGAMNALVAHRAPRNPALRWSAGALAIFGLTLAVPLQLHQSALTIGWISEAAILLLLSGRLQSELLRRAGQIVWLLTALPLLGDLTTPAPAIAASKWLSASAFPLAFCVAVSALIAWNARRGAESEDFDEMEPSYAVFSVLGGAYFLSREIYRAFELHLAASSQFRAQKVYFSAAIVLGTYALAVFALGLKWRHQTMRFCALALVVLVALIPVMAAFSMPVLPGTPVWNARAAAFLSIGAIIWVFHRLLNSETNALTEFERQIAGVSAFGTASFLLLGASLELFFGFYNARLALGPHWVTTAVFALSVGWSLAATLLFYLGCRPRQSSLRALSLGTGLGAFAALLGDSLLGEMVGPPFLNARFGAFAIALVSLALCSRIARLNQAKIGEFGLQLRRVTRFVALGLLLWALTQESYTWSQFSRQMLGANWERTAQMLISLVWSLFGALLLLVGIGRREQGLRLAALGLLSATVVKVFVFDLGFVNGPARVLSLGGLGASLLFISYLYSRFGSVKADIAAEP